MRLAVSPDEASSDWVRAGQAPVQGSVVSVRRFPYPYEAALAICNDIDMTRDIEEFLEIQRFLNTKGTTSMGEGIGLEIGNSLFFYNQQHTLSYFAESDYARSVMIDLIHAGFVDSLHSYGDEANTREQIERALDVLQRESCHLDVWSNHFGAASNLSPKFRYMFRDCRGDDPSSEVYHTDLTIPYGIRFAWVGATTRLVGQSPSQPLSFLVSVFDRRHPVPSIISMVKEFRKSSLGARGDERFALHSSNQLTQPLRLRDGRKVHEFIRYIDHPKGVSLGATSRGLAYAISMRALQRLKAVHGFTIIYTHLGKNDGCEEVIAKETQEALRNLEQEYRAGKIYVTTTSKLLGYYLALRYLEWSEQRDGRRIKIIVEGINDPVFGQSDPTVEQLQGLTFYVPESRLAEVYVGGRMVGDLQRNSADESGRESVTIPFVQLSFPYDKPAKRK